MNVEKKQILLLFETMVSSHIIFSKTKTYSGTPSLSFKNPLNVLKTFSKLKMRHRLQ